MSEHADVGEGRRRAAVIITALVVVGIAIIGFVTGTRMRPYEVSGELEPYVEPERHADDPVPAARSYGELRDTPRGRGSGWTEDVLALNAALPGITDAVELTGTDKRQALLQRADRRAYTGAPPTIPHMIRQDSAPECLACHEDGLKLGERLAPKRPHDAFTSCTQCHVTAITPMPGGMALPEDPRAVDNSFSGLPSPTRGPRAWTIAPPQIPHRTFMKERCASCHGVGGRNAIRSSHPWRQSCTQCHAPSAELDQRTGG